LINQAPTNKLNPYKSFLHLTGGFDKSSPYNSYMYLISIKKQPVVLAQ